MNKSEQHKLNRLLSGGAELSVQEKEEMLSVILGEGERPAHKRSRSVGFLWAGPIAAAAAIALLALYVGLAPGREEGDEARFTARGGGGGVFRIECLGDDGEAGPCAIGNRIAFGLLPPEGAAYFSAAAVDRSGRLIRYFPSETEGSLRLAEPGVQSKGITIGPEHRPGRHRVFGVFSAAPLSTEQLKRVIEAYAEGSESSVSGVVQIRETDMVVVSR